MIKLLTILLFPLLSFSQVTIVAGGINSFNTAGIGTIGGATFTSGKLYILFIATTAAAAPGATTVTSTNTTWTQIATVSCATTGSPTIRLTAFRFAPTSTVSETLTVTTSGGQTGAWAYSYEITGADVTGTNGAGAIVQSGTANDNATITPTITLSALSSSKNAVLFAFANDLNPPAATAEAGWTENIDNGFATPNCGGYAMHRLTGTDNTPSVTAATFDNWGAIAIEIKSLPQSGLPLFFFSNNKHENNSNSNLYPFSISSVRPTP